MNRIRAALCGAALLTCGASAAPAETPAAPPARPLPSGYLAPYLAADARPNGLAFTPPPPAPGSAAQARDDEASKALLALRGTPRWDVATADAVLAFPKAAETFSCALGVQIDEPSTPKLYTILRRTLLDAGLAPYSVKNLYKRERPFMSNGQPICTPAEDAVLRRDGSYPSGHSAVGWTWGLILAEAAPDRGDALVARGRAFGQSRAVCNVHWLSDTEEGRVVGTAVFVRLQGNAEFQADLAAARNEIAAARAAGKTPKRDCAAETAALAKG